MSSKVHILYADDDEDDHVFFKEALKTLNEPRYVVTSVYDGAEVINLLTQRGKYKNSKSPLPDILILDLNMPVIDGFGILKELRSAFNKNAIPVYILSVSDKEHDKKKCEELGCTQFYTKPVDFSKLTQVISQILENQKEFQKNKNS